MNCAADFAADRPRRGRLQVEGLALDPQALLLFIRRTDNFVFLYTIGSWANFLNYLNWHEVERSAFRLIRDEICF